MDAKLQTYYITPEFKVQNILDILNGEITDVLAYYYLKECGINTADYKPNSHRDKLKKQTLGQLEPILNSQKISNEALIAARKLKDFLAYATSSNFQWDNAVLFEMMSDHYERVRKDVLELIW